MVYDNKTFKYTAKGKNYKAKGTLSCVVYLTLFGLWGTGVPLL